jgi:integrase
MSPYRNGQLFWTRCPRSDRRRVLVSTGTGDKRTAVAIARMVDDLKARGRFDILDAVCDRTLRLLDVYGDYRADATVAKATASLGDPDLSPFVDEWAGGGSTKYLKQVRRFIPQGILFPASRFRRRELSRFLAELTALTSGGKMDDHETPVSARPASPATRNRYRAALSVFATWLVEREILETNPVRDVPAATVKPRSITFLEPEQVRSLVEALPHPYRAFEAVLAGTGMGFSAAATLRRRDVDTRTRIVLAKGSKAEYGARHVAVTEPWAWTILAAHLKALSPNAPLFPEIREDTALARHHATAKALGLPRTTLHQHRHSYAVMQLRRGCDHQWLKTQLGHAPQSTLIYTAYGDYMGATKRTSDEKDLKQTPPQRQKTL